ncbi:hypothetical protein TcBrA4_0032060 [Trypanosoma cruzi]|nr:hypothetical protein TcBrA4_0032060 [Trypanosoma cruzi]
MSGAVLFCHSVYLVRSPLLTNWSAFSVHRRAMVSPQESDGMLLSQASMCASTSASISCGSSAQSCTSKSSAIVLFAEEGGRHADDAIMLVPAAGLMVACAARCGRQGRSCHRLWPLTDKNGHTAATTVAISPVVLHPARPKAVASGLWTSTSHSSHKTTRPRHATSCSAPDVSPE